MRHLAALLLPQLALGRMYDVVLPHLTPPAGCRAKNWSTLGPAADFMWIAGAPPADAGASCAIPAAATDGGLERCFSPSNCSTAYFGAICPCAAPGGYVFSTCEAHASVPEQINLQLASAGAVVASFVTFDAAPPRSAPQALLTHAADGARLLAGLSHQFSTFHANTSKWCKLDRTCAKRNYTLNFVRLAGLRPRQNYSYKVRVAEGQPWSRELRFRAPYGPSSEGATRVAIYGDMGNTQWNNMANLRADCAAGRVDAIFHLGDHCYDMALGDDRHGDAYMNAFEPTIASCPWVPVIGNHESAAQLSGDADASGEARYLDQTWGVVYDGGEPPAVAEAWRPGGPAGRAPLASTATSALGHLLTKGSFYGAAVHSRVASRTSQWMSIDLGLIHFVTLDLNYGKFEGAQLEWARRDLALAAANRAAVPWIVVTSHFPIYTAALSDAASARASAAWYMGEAAEAERNGGPWAATPSFESCEANDANCTTAAELMSLVGAQLGPLLEEFSVDIYQAGHVHSYSTTWPVCNGTLCDGKQSYDDPGGPVHVVDGNGGVPNDMPQSGLVYRCNAPGNRAPADLFRNCGVGGAYGRLIAHDALELKYEHVDNNAKKCADPSTGCDVLDHWAIRRSHPKAAKPLA